MRASAIMVNRASELDPHSQVEETSGTRSDGRTDEQSTWTWRELGGDAVQRVHFVASFNRFDFYEASLYVKTAAPIVGERNWPRASLTTVKKSQ